MQRAINAAGNGKADNGKPENIRTGRRIRVRWLWLLCALMSLVVVAPAWAQSCGITLSPATLPDGIVGTAYNQTVSASGGVPAYSYSVSVGSLPPGLALDPVTGAISGTPTTAGAASFTVTANDQVGCFGSQAYTPFIFAAIALSPATLPNGTAGTAYNQTITASGGTAPYSFAVTAGSLPTGLSLNASGALTGTPTAAGSFNFSVTATDANAFTGAQAYTVVIAAPAITVSPATLPNGTAGTAYNQTITASGGTAPYSFAVTAGSLPTGLSLNASGALTGTPTAAGSFNFSVTATDANAFTGTQAYTLVIAAPAITVSPATLPNGTAGTAYNQTITASGGTAPYSFAVTAGSLPTGLSLNASGALTGTPTTSGSFNFTITVTDANAFTGTQAYTVVIAAPAITVSPATLPNGTAGTAYNQTITASGGTAPHSFAVTAGSLPTGLSLNASGALTGTPTASGSFNFTVTATDANAFTGTRTYTVAIGAPGLVLSPATLPNGTAGVAYAATFSMSGGTAPYAFAVTAGALPPGLSLSGAGALSGSPTTPGTYNFSVQGTDANGFSTSRAYALTILIPGGVPTAVSRSVATVMGVPVQVDLTAGATGGPFVSATLVSVAPSGTAVIAQTGSGPSTGYTLTFTPAPGFTGPATVTFTISSVFATSAPATITINVAARPDPRLDPDVVGLLTTQTLTARRFIDTQILNVRTRLEVLHDPSPSVWGFWVGGTSRHGDRNAEGGGSAQAFGTSGFSMGLDRRINSRFAVGGGVGYDRDRTDVGVSGSRSDAKATTALAYGSLHPQLPFFLDATFGHQRLTFQLRRYVPQTQTMVESPRDGVQNFSSWSAGYDYRGKRWSWSPYARMDVAQATLDPYTEQGDGGVYELRYDGQSIATRTSIFGLRSKFKKQVRWGKLETRFRLEVQHDYHDQNGDTIRYADLPSGSGYVIEPAQEDRSRTILELGAILETKHGITLNLEYRNVFGGLYDNDRSLTLSFQKDDRQR